MSLLFSLTVITVTQVNELAGETITMIDTAGYHHPITSNTVFTTLWVGWAAFVLSLIFNILYYVLHPSQVNQMYI